MTTTPAPAAQPQGEQASEPVDNSLGLTSIGMLVAPLVAAIGGLALTGTIGRVQRDEPGWFSLAIGCVIVAGALWVAASALTSPKKDGKRSCWDVALKAIACFLAVGGFVIALSIAVSIANNPPRPQITATVSDDGTKLTTEIKASNLSTDRRLAFRIDLLKKRNVVGSLYLAYVGPDSDGNVEETIATRLPPGDYNEVGVKAFTSSNSASCDDFSEVRNEETFETGTGCVILRVDPPQVKKKQGEKKKPKKAGDG